LVPGLRPGGAAADGGGVNLPHPRPVSLAGRTGAADGRGGAVWHRLHGPVKGPDTGRRLSAAAVRADAADLPALEPGEPGRRLPVGGGGLPVRPGARAEPVPRSAPRVAGADQATGRRVPRPELAVSGRLLRWCSRLALAARGQREARTTAPLSKTPLDPPRPP